LMWRRHKAIFGRNTYINTNFWFRYSLNTEVMTLEC